VHLFRSIQIHIDLVGERTDEMVFSPRGARIRRAATPSAQVMAADLALGLVAGIDMNQNAGIAMEMIDKYEFDGFGLPVALVNGEVFR
jgi:hypothetical protein